ncbi:MAG: HD domain-containing protein [Candidatus Bathyarchaeota archaeon]|nr:MAG: HD domain-containing protein [Candidatus Bathyarchaeota archaeon]
MKNLEGLLEFMTSVGKLKRIPRTGWLEAGVKEPESIADHIFRTSILALLLADLQGVDSEKVVRMALIHDLAEAQTGDLTPEQKQKKGVEHLIEEEEAMERLLSNLPKKIAEIWGSLWEDYRSGRSPEARIVLQADRLEMILQALEYEEEGMDPSKLDRFLLVEEEEGLPSELLRELEKKRDRIESKLSAHGHVSYSLRDGQVRRANL